MVDASPSLARRLKRFAADDRAIAAVEMAFLAPVALGFLSVVVAGGQAITLYHKTVLSAHVVTDMVSRSPYSPDPSVSTAESLSSTSLDTDLALSQLVFYPYDPTNLQVVMTEVLINPTTNTGTVVWSEAYNGGTPVSCSTIYNLDPSYAASGATYLLFGTTTYNYQPLGGMFQLGPLTLTSTETLTIRNAQQITVPGVQEKC